MTAGRQPNVMPRRRLPKRPAGLSRSHFIRSVDPARWLCYQIKARAKAQGRRFNLTPADIPVPTHCPVLGIKLSWASRMTTPSVDRIDNRLGYVRGNVVVVSWRANWLKGDATLAELKALVKFYGKEARVKTTGAHQKGT